MAQVPLNKFKLIAKQLLNGDNLIYQETVNDTTAIILSAQISNTSNSTKQVTVKVVKDSTPPITISLIKQAQIPANDALNPLSGKLVLEKNDKLIFEAFEDNVLEAVLSVLENANE